MNRQLCKFFLITSLFLTGLLCSTSKVEALPQNFQDTVVWSGLTTPTAISFAPNGKVFVAEKSGIIKVFDNLQDTTPTVFADLSNRVQDYGDRGLLGLVVDPQFPTRPYVYVLYTMDGPLGSSLPFYNDSCTNPDFCPAGSRLSKLTANASGNTMISEQVLIENWCQIESSHSVGTLAFGSDGALYVSHGEGASYNYVDYGQDGGCPDPTNEGGALRSQDIRTSGDPTGYNGSLLRVNPDTGAAFTGNPLAGGVITDDDPIIAHGFRNPFRFSIDPQSGAVWVADVGWNDWEEVNYIPTPTASVSNFGWPCYEGNAKQSGYDAANIPICETLYNTAGAVKDPYYAYPHFGFTRAVSAIAVYKGSDFPATYTGALFFGDYTQGWIRVMMPLANGLPNAGNVVDFIASGVYPVDMKVGPNGALYYVDIINDTVHQVSYLGLNNIPPVAHISANQISGPLPLSVSFNGSTSIDADGDPLQYAWDLDGDGNFNDSTAVSPVFNYTQNKTVSVKLRVTDNHSGTSTDSITIYAGNSAPVATILTPGTSTPYSVGDSIPFSAKATDADVVGNLPPSAFHWAAVLYHCAINDPNECHAHDIQSFNGVDSGFLTAPDHEYPSRIELRLTVNDPAAPTLVDTKSVTIQPRTTTWTFNSNPSGLQLVAYGETKTTPFTRTVIVNAQSTISAPTPQVLGAASYSFANWSDGGAATHNVTAGASAQTFTAAYTLNTGPTFSVTTLGGSFATKTTGGPTWNGDGGWIIWSDGYIAQPINFPQAGQYNVVVNALGELAGNALPHMEVRLDGVVVGAADVPNSAAYAPFPFTINVGSSGSHLLAIAFTNDFYATGADRNLDVKDVTVSSGSVATPVCGDGIKNGTEQCDGTAGVGAHQSCSATCTLINIPYCGDGIKSDVEQCDGTDGVGANQTCSATCTLINTPPLSFNYTILGKDMATKTTGGPTWNGDGGWIIWSNGYIAQSITFPQTAQYVVKINALGDLAGSALPHMEVRLDGVTVGNADVGNNTAYAPFTYTLNIPSGSHQLAIAFTNDFYATGADRNLEVFNLTVSSVTQAPAVCGDGIKNGTEQCDGTAGVGAHQSCSATCTLINLPYCGDAIKNGTEQCDGTDGVGPNQACSATCTLTALPVCGDGIKNGTEQCDGTSGVGANQSCSATCTLINLPYCGDGIKNGAEQCDGTSGVGAGQSCSATCTLIVPVCGDGIKNGTEQCDGTSGVGANQTCSATCTLINLPYCGDGIKNGSEQCDGTSGVGAGQSCSATCTLITPVCGDGIKNGTEQCDGTSGVGANQSCSATCTLINLPYCGDGIKNGTEQCDGTDGVGANQSCSAQCTILDATIIPFSYSIAAQNMTTKTTGQGMWPQGWNIWSNGYIAQNITFPQAGSYKIVVTARGDLAGADLPKMEVRIDGTAQATVNVGATSWTQYIVTVNIPSAASHQVAIAFTNDFSGMGRDRNLLVYSMDISR